MSGLHQRRDRRRVHRETCSRLPRSSTATRSVRASARSQARHSVREAGWPTLSCRRRCSSLTWISSMSSGASAADTVAGSRSAPAEQRAAHGPGRHQRGPGAASVVPVQAARVIVEPTDVGSRRRLAGPVMARRGSGRRWCRSRRSRPGHRGGRSARVPPVRLDRAGSTLPAACLRSPGQPRASGCHRRRVCDGWH
jgi:hypothetical protein